MFSEAQGGLRVCPIDTERFGGVLWSPESFGHVLWTLEILPRRASGVSYGHWRHCQGGLRACLKWTLETLPRRASDVSYEHWRHCQGGIQACLMDARDRHDIDTFLAGAVSITRVQWSEITVPLFWPVFHCVM